MSNSEAPKITKVILIENIPVDPRHGLKSGNVYPAIYKENRDHGGAELWVKGALGEDVKLHSHEYEILK